MAYRRRVWTGKGPPFGAWACFSILLAIAVASARAGGKVGLLDFQIVLSTLRGMEGGRVEGEVRVRSQEIEALERELKRVKEDYARERPRLSLEQRERYEREILQRTEGIQNLHGEAVKEAMFKIRLRPVEGVRAELEGLIQRFARENNFALILDSKDRRVLYRAEGADGETKAKEEVDITRTLLELLPQELAAGRLGPGAGQ